MTRRSYPASVTIGRVGTILVVAGLVCLGIAIATGIAGQGVGLGMSGTNGVLLIAAIGLVGLGCAVLAVAGPAPIHGRPVRISLGIVAVGLLSLLGSDIAGRFSAYDSLESLPLVILTLGGVLLTLIGVAALAITLPMAWSARGREDAV
jgi:hypothetical protein